MFDNVQKQPPEEFCKNEFLKVSQISQENTCIGVSLCEIFINTCFEEHLRTNTSEDSKYSFEMIKDLSLVKTIALTQSQISKF